MEGGPAPPFTRDRFAEFSALRHAARLQAIWLRETPAASGLTTSSPSENETPSQWLPMWIRTLHEFTELEQKIQNKVDALFEQQRLYFKPRFTSDNEEETLRQSIDQQASEIQRLLRELERMVLAGMKPADTLNDEEQRIVSNAQKLLSTRLKALIRSFKSCQELFGNHLKQRERKEKKFMQIGSEDTVQMIEQEERAARFMEMGYTDADIQELLLEEIRQDTVSKEIKEILDSIQELQGMFEDLNTLVVEQGTMLDRIDFNLQKTQEHVSKGLVELNKAKKKQEESACCVM